jgi:broad specificity phosphatase PhoE
VPDTRLYLIRHGATDLTAENRFSGATGDLSDEGRRQIGALAERLRKEEIHALYASPLQRTLDSALIIGGAIGLTPILKDDLREISHGEWEGLTHDEARAKHPRSFEAWQRDPFHHAAEGGESGQDVLDRARPVMRDIVAAERGKRVAVVSHKATLRLILCDFLGIDPRGYRDKLEQSPACLNIVVVGDAGATLVLLNG